MAAISQMTKHEARQLVEDVMEKRIYNLDMS